MTASGDAGFSPSSNSLPSAAKTNVSSFKNAADRNSPSSAVSFSAAVAALKRSDAVAAKIAASGFNASAPASSSSGCGAFLRLLGFPGVGPPSLSPSAASSVQFLVGLAATPLDDDDPLHPRILRTVFQNLRPKDFPSVLAIKRYGKHWEEIGFQVTSAALQCKVLSPSTTLALFHSRSD